MQLPTNTNKAATVASNGPPAYFDVTSENNSEALPSYDINIPLHPLAKNHDKQSLAQRRLDSNTEEHVQDYVDAQPHLSFPTADAAAADTEAQLNPPLILEAQHNARKRKGPIITLLVLSAILAALWGFICIYLPFFSRRDFCTNAVSGQALFLGLPALIFILMLGVCHAVSVTGYYRNAKGNLVAVTDKKKHSSVLGWWLFAVICVCIGLGVVRLGCRNGWYGDDRGYIFGAVE